MGGNPVSCNVYFKVDTANIMTHNYLLLYQVNCVVMRGLNEDEICNFVAMTEDKVSIEKIEAE